MMAALTTVLRAATGVAAELMQWDTATRNIRLVLKGGAVVHQSGAPS